MRNFSQKVIRKLVSMTRSKPRHGMTNLREQQYFQHYAQKLFLGEGEIVDLGCWLGSTTIPLAIGLSKNPAALRKGRLIHAYDIFIWEKWMDPFKDGCSKSYEPGESFLDEYQSRVRAYAKWLKVYQEDLEKTKWTGKPIEFLLIDAMKSWELAQAIVRNFYPSLIPGTSYLLHQDFKHWYTPWIHLIQYRLRDYFDPVHNICESPSLVFRLRKKLDNDFSWLNDLKSWSEKEVNAAFAYSLWAVENDTESLKDEVLAAKIMYYIHLDRLDEAKALLADVLAQKASLQSYCFTCCQEFLAAK